MTDEVKNLSSLYGFARLYATLIQDGGNRQQTMDMLYNCYCANVTAYNAQQGEQIIPVSQSVFYKMMTNQAEPYKTDIQTIKALTLLMWNTGAGPAMEAISNVQNDYAYRFYAETYYAYCDSVTSFSLCEDTLDPEHEPTMELNPALLMRKYDTGPKLVYISAPLRGDVEKNIAYAKEKAADFKVIFVRKPLIISTLREDVKWMKAHAFQVEKVELTERQFAYFSSNLGEAMLFIELDKNCMYEQDGCTHCLLVTTPTRGEGILVDAEGYDHARYAAYIPDCSRLALDGVPTDRYSDVPQIKARRKQPSLER